MPGHLGLPMPMLFYMLVILQMESGLHSSGGGDLDVIIYDYRLPRCRFILLWVISDMRSFASGGGGVYIAKPYQVQQLLYTYSITL